MNSPAEMLIPLTMQRLGSGSLVVIVRIMPSQIFFVSRPIAAGSWFNKEADEVDGSCGG
jgi:hypothetical protein